MDTLTKEVQELRNLLTQQLSSRVHGEEEEDQLCLGARPPRPAVHAQAKGGTVPDQALTFSPPTVAPHGYSDAPFDTRRRDTASASHRALQVPPDLAPGNPLQGEVADTTFAQLLEFQLRQREIEQRAVQTETERTRNVLLYARLLSHK